jgi:hypothetical protein
MKPTAEHLKLMDGLKAAIGLVPQMPAQEVLAIVSQLVGNLVALQDAQRYTPAQVMAMVSHNVEIGNREAVTAAAFGKFKP